MLRDLRFLLVLAVVSALAACVTTRSPGDRAFEAGDYAAAAAAYEGDLQRDPNARTDARLLLRLGLAYAEPDSAVYEPERALEVLRDVATRFPKDPYGAQATLLFPRVEREVRLAAALASERRRIADLEGQLARALEEAQALDAGVKTRDEQLARLRTSLAEAQSQLRRVREELEQLKRIDLQRRR